MMSLWDALRMNMMISYQELVRTFPNPTPFYMNFSVITVGGKTFKPTLPEQTYVAPATERLFTIPAGAVGNTISWKIINDYGTSGKEFHSKY
ncbi:hypothetical protein KLPMCP290B_25845 [Klebsiella pneumoniae]